MNIELTVALPIWRGNDIAWLAMEGLCRQDRTLFDWELMICEEGIGNPLGKQFFADYLPRLRNCGCSKLSYISLDRWLPLSQKWRLMGQRMAKSSNVFLLQAADCYSFKERLNESYQRIVDEGNTWYDVGHGYFYSLASGRMILFQQASQTHSQLAMALSADCARTIPNVALRRNIDNFLLQHCMRTVAASFCRHVDMAEYAGVDTNGYNNISITREDYFERPRRPFAPTDKKLKDIGLPDDITQHLHELTMKTAAEEGA